MGIYTPPANITERTRTKPSVFLAGTIDMGDERFKTWQSDFALQLKEKYHIFNPRRIDWDSTWKQDFENPQFFQQVMWELNALTQSDVIIINFLPGSKSPISLLELGKYGGNDQQRHKVYVLCPYGYEKKGNVDVFCHVHGIPLYVDADTLITDLNNSIYSRVIKNF